MGQKVSGYVDDETAEYIDAIAEHYGLAKTKVMALLIREGIQARTHRIRLEQLNAKLDVLMEGYAAEDEAREAIRDQWQSAADVDLPGSVFASGSVKEPFPAFQSPGLQPEEWSGPPSDEDSDDGEFTFGGPSDSK